MKHFIISWQTGQITTSHSVTSLLNVFVRLCSVGVYTNEYFIKSMLQNTGNPQTLKAG